MRSLLLLAALPALASLALPPDRFEASGTEPKWKLRIAPETVRFDYTRGGKRKRDLGRVDRIERSSGRALVSAAITEYEFHPLGITTGDGRPISNIESSEVPLSIEVIEAPCTDASGRSFPTRVAITDGSDTQYRGCGGPLASLAGPVSQR